MVDEEVVRATVEEAAALRVVEEVCIDRFSLQCWVYFEKFWSRKKDRARI